MDPDSRGGNVRVRSGSCRMFLNCPASLARNRVHSGIMQADGGYISQWDLLLGTAAMDYCTRCGDPRTTGAPACPRCGTRFGEPPGDATQADMPYADPSPTIWDYGLPGPALGYFDEQQKLPTDTSDPFWRVFAGAAQPAARPGGPAMQGGPRPGGPPPGPARP